MDVAHGEAVEAELSRLIEKRSSREPDPDELEPGYMESVRRYHEQRREQHRWEWVRFFDRMAESHARLSEGYKERAEKLLGNLEG